MTKKEIRDYNKALNKLAKSGNKRLVRIAKTYVTYRNKINDYERRGFITETLSINNYIEAYQELELKMDALGWKFKSKSEKLAALSKIFSKAEYRTMKEKAATDDVFKYMIGLEKVDVSKLSMHAFMKKLQSSRMNREDLWSACVSACGKKYDAAEALYNDALGIENTRRRSTED